MAEASDTLTLIYQNLMDAGCDAKTTENCMSFVRAGNFGECCRFSYSIEKRSLVQCGQGKRKSIV